MISIKSISQQSLKEWMSKFEAGVAKVPIDSSNSTQIGWIKALSQDIISGIDERETSLALAKNIILSTDFYVDETQKDIKLNGVSYSFELVRKQVLISLFSQSGGIYDSCARLCYLLCGEKEPPYQAYFKDIFFTSGSSVYKSSAEIIGKIKQEYDYPIALVLFIRNCFMHRGEVLLENSFFDNSIFSVKDALNSELIPEIEKMLMNHYNIRNLNKAAFDLSLFSGKSVVEAFSSALILSDHSTGMLLTSLLGKHTNIL